MVLSQQSFPYTTAKYLNKVFVDNENRRSSIFTSKSNLVQESTFFDKLDDGTAHTFIISSSILSIRNI